MNLTALVGKPCNVSNGKMNNSTASPSKGASGAMKISASSNGGTRDDRGMVKQGLPK
jgi:hypothetical protein